MEVVRSGDGRQEGGGCGARVEEVYLTLIGCFYTVAKHMHSQFCRIANDCD